jgi:hypothetical protein
MDTKLGHFSLQNCFNSGALNAIVLSVIMLRVILQSLTMLVVSSTIIPSAIRMIVLLPSVILSQTDTKLGHFSFQGFFISYAVAVIMLTVLMLSAILQSLIMLLVMLSVVILIILSVTVPTQQLLPLKFGILRHFSAFFQHFTACDKTLQIL